MKQSSALRYSPSLAEVAKLTELLKREGAAKIYLFGSVARDTANAHSDIDLVVVMDDIDYQDRHLLRGCHAQY